MNLAVQKIITNQKAVKQAEKEKVRLEAEKKANQKMRFHIGGESWFFDKIKIKIINWKKIYILKNDDNEYCYLSYKRMTNRGEELFFYKLEDIKNGDINGRIEKIKVENESNDKTRNGKLYIEEKGEKKYLGSRKSNEVKDYARFVLDEKTGDEELTNKQLLFKSISTNKKSLHELLKIIGLKDKEVELGDHKGITNKVKIEENNFYKYLEWGEIARCFNKNKELVSIFGKLEQTRESLFKLFGIEKSNIELSYVPVNRLIFSCFKGDKKMKEKYLHKPRKRFTYNYVHKIGMKIRKEKNNETIQQFMTSGKRREFAVKFNKNANETEYLNSDKFDDYKLPVNLMTYVKDMLEHYNIEYNKKNDKGLESQKIAYLLYQGKKEDVKKYLESIKNNSNEIEKEQFEKILKDIKANWQNIFKDGNLKKEIGDTLKKVGSKKSRLTLVNSKIKKRGFCFEDILFNKSIRNLFARFFNEKYGKDKGIIPLSPKGISNSVGLGRIEDRGEIKSKILELMA